MGRRNALAYDGDELDRQVDALMTRATAVVEEPARKTRRTPHERERIPRRMGLTLPDADWAADLQEECARIGGGCRPSDVLVLAYAHYRAGVESGQIQRPRGDVAYWQRAGEAFDLPWEPE